MENIFKINKLKSFLFKYWRTLFLIALCLVFFTGVSAYNHHTQKENFVKWGSPDESANFIMAKLYGETGELRIYEKYNLYAENIIHPRSFRSDSGYLKLLSFLGLPLIYGKISSFAGSFLIPYFTPFLAALGLIYYYLLVKRFFGKNNALVSVLLLAFFPVYVYYSARSMFHNVPFVVFLLVGFYYLLFMGKKYESRIKNKLLKISLKETFYAALSGLFIGLALITRTSELLWVLPVLIFLWIFNFKKISIFKAIIFVSTVFMVFIPVFYYNQFLYTKFYYGGYNEMNKSIITIGQAGSDLISLSAKGDYSFHNQLFNNLKSTVFYFGLHPRQSFDMFKAYFVKMFPFVFWLGIFGLIIFLTPQIKKRKKHWLYLAVLFFISFILVLYYGSWRFFDNPDATQATIGNSYTRYWLPIYMGFLPFASLFIIRLTKEICSFIFLKFKRPDQGSFFSIKIRKNLCLIGLRAVFIILIIFASVQYVLIGSSEGLVFSAVKQKSAQYEFNEVIGLTETDSIIITRYHDKLFFPERKVIVGLFDDVKIVSYYAKLADHLPVYYYNFTFPQKDIDYLNSRRLAEAGLGIKEIKKITADFTLYRLDKIAYPAETEAETEKN